MELKKLLPLIPSRLEKFTFNLRLFLTGTAAYLAALSVSYSLRNEHRLGYLLFAINLFISKGMRPKQTIPNIPLYRLQLQDGARCKVNGLTQNPREPSKYVSSR